MRLRFLYLSVCFLLAIHTSYGQEVEHNFTVKPQQTNCDSLKIDRYSKEEAIREITMTNFRFDQAFQLSRKNGLQSGAFYSCDLQTGSLIIKYNDTEYLYINVSKSLWNDLISSGNPEDFYIRIKQVLEEFR